MPDSTVDLNTLEDQYSSGVYVKRDVQILRGEGAYLWDSEGNRYYDCVGGQGSANLGHAHPAITQAIQTQAAELISCPELFHNPIRARYQAALCQAANMPRVYLCNSGAEAMEGALKFARLTTGRTGVLATMRGFHGRTMGALSLTWEKSYREPFLPLLPDVQHVPYNKIERIEKAFAQSPDQIGAVVVEAVQGEGGVHPAEDGYLKAVQDLCHQHGALFVVDEIQTGFGRAGTLFAHHQDGVQPDLITLAKSIAGGVPMGAVLIGERVGELSPATHGSTFGGNPLACAAAMAALDVYQSEGFLERIHSLGDEVRQHLSDHLKPEAYREIRGRGFMVGIELRQKVAPILAALQEKGVLALPAGRSVLRLLPPLVMTDEDLWQVIEIIEETLNDAV